MLVPLVLVCGYHAVMINNGAVGRGADQGGMYLPDTEFGDDPCHMTVEVGPDGVRVESVCCCATMDEQTARELHAALQAWVADRDAAQAYATTADEQTNRELHAALKTWVADPNAFSEWRE